MTKLTNAQIYTLRRMSSGTRYLLRGDCRKANECRASPSDRGWHPVSAPSIVVLHRTGYVEFISNEKQVPTQYYRVCMTEKGKVAAEKMEIKEAT